MKSATTAVLFLTLACPLSAQEGASDETLRHEQKITVTAGHVPAPVDEVGSSVTVVNAAEIEASGARWASDVLEQIPGVTLARSGGPGTVASLFLRGANSNHTLVLIDGFKANTPSTGGYDFSHLPAGLIERIEVVRGPQSSLYGSEALAGVVHIITRAGAGRAAGVRTDLPAAGAIEADLGSYGTGRGQAAVSGASGRVDYQAGMALHSSDGFSAAAGSRGNREDDGYRNLTADAGLGVALGERARLHGLVRVYDARTDSDDFDFAVGPTDDPNFETDTREVVVGARLDVGRGRWSASIAAGTTESELESVNPDGLFSTGNTLDASVRQASFTNRLDLASGRHVLAFGAAYRNEAAESVSLSPFGDSVFDRDVDVASLFASDRISWKRLHADLAARFEDHSRFGDEVTYRAALSLAAGGGLRPHASVGTGFRAPSLNDLYFPGFSNPDLGAETSLGYDLGLEARAADAGLVLDLTWFRNQVDDLIQFSVATNRPENIGEVTSDGVELSGSWSPRPAVTVAGEYTWTRSIDETSDEQLVRRPRHQGSLRLDLRPVRRLRLSTDILAKGERSDFGVSGTTILDGFAVWNAAVDLDLVSGLAVIARVDNLLDEEYEEVFGFGTPGRSGYAGLRYRFGNER